MLDIVGALVTCAVTAALFATNFVPTGLPVPVLLGMSLAAAVFCGIGIVGYTTSCDAAPTLRWLAMLNAAFCVVSGGLWLVYLNSLTWVGRIYFPGEILIVATLAIAECQASTSLGSDRGDA